MPSYSVGYRCDVCRRSWASSHGSLDEVVQHCDECSFDLCPNCAAQPLVCDAGHPLRAVTYDDLVRDEEYENYFCDRCHTASDERTDFRSDEIVCHCKECAFDLCPHCACGKASTPAVVAVTTAAPPPRQPKPMPPRPMPVPQQQQLTGELTEKVVKSALVIIPPKELWGPIQELRKKYDKAYDRWMPHINILYPFVPESAFEQARARIATAFAKAPRFHLTLAELGFFDFGRSCTMWTHPVASPSNSLSRLHAMLLSLFPQCTETSEKGEFTPHLTLGQFPGKSATEEMIVRTDWTPIEFDVEAVQLISRTAEDPFSVKFTVPLASSDEAAAASSGFEFVEWNGRNAEGSVLWLRIQTVDGHVMGAGRLDGREFTISEGIATPSGEVQFKFSFDGYSTCDFNGTIDGSTFNGSFASAKSLQYTMTRESSEWEATASAAAVSRPKVDDIVAIDADAEEKACIRIERWIGSNKGSQHKSLPKTRAKLCSAIAPLCNTTYQVQSSVVLQHLEEAGLVTMRGDKAILKQKAVDPADVPATPATSFPEILADVLSRARAWCLSQKAPPRTREALMHGLQQLCRIKHPLSPETVIDTLVRRNTLTIDPITSTIHYNC